MAPLGFAGFATVSLAALVAVLAGFTFRIDVVEAQMVRSRPGWGLASVFLPFAAVACWGVFARHASWGAHVLSYAAGVIILGFMALIFRPVLPVVLVAGGSDQ